MSGASKISEKMSLRYQLTANFTGGDGAADISYSSSLDCCRGPNSTKQLHRIGAYTSLPNFSSVMPGL
jgi:hypothetical protein